MAKIKYIPCDIYKRGITIFVGTLNDFKQWVKKEYTDEKENDFVEMVMALKDREIGEASFNYDNMNGDGVVLIPSFPKTPNQIAILVHELLHATFFILNFCHVEYTYDGNNECYTYLLEHLTRCTLEYTTYENIE